MALAIGKEVEKLFYLVLSRSTCPWSCEIPKCKRVGSSKGKGRWEVRALHGPRSEEEMGVADILRTPKAPPPQVEPPAGAEQRLGAAGS